MSDDTEDRIKTRTDRYAENRTKLRNAAQTTAMRRIWDMAREALATRANLGVKSLSYSSDLIPGITDAQIVAYPTHVEVTISGLDWTPGPADEHDKRTDPMRYVIDEAWLLGVTIPS